MMKYELGLDKPDRKRAQYSALNIGAAYIVGGIVPLSAYFFTQTPHEGLIYSSLINILCLLIFGYFKARFTGSATIFRRFQNNGNWSSCRSGCLFHCEVVLHDEVSVLLLTTN